MKTPSRLLLTSLVVVAPLRLAWGAFTYQGRLNIDGTLASGNYDFRLRLAADPQGNSYLGLPYLSNNVPVTNGLFLLWPDFEAGAFTGNPLWLQVDVKTNGASGYTTLFPLQALTATPYAVFAQSASNLNGTLPGAQVSGPIPNSALPASPTFLGPVTASGFVGNGAGVTNVNAATLNGLSSAAFWKVSGNALAAGQFLGSTNNVPLEFQANGIRALRLEYANDPAQGVAPNVIAGSPGNLVSNGVFGATIAGGGSPANANVVGGSYATVIGGENNLALGVGSIAGGILCSASKDNSVALGTWNTASGPASCTIGYWDSAAGQYAVALGTAAAASADNTVAIGVSVTALKTNALALGAGSGALGLSSVALGASSGAMTNNAIAIGNSSYGQGRNSIAIGFNSYANADDAIAIGSQNGANGQGATALGIHTVATGAAATALGSNTIAGGDFSLAVGNSSYAYGDDSLAFGQNAFVNALSAVAIGDNASATGQNAFALGPHAAANANNAHALGYWAAAQHSGAFVWSDTSGGSFASSATNEFSIRAQNGVRVATDKGIHLSAGDRPIITRDWDVFATNAPTYKAGIGRWGLFMEPYRLTLGIPANDIGARYFQVAKYSTNGTPTQLMQVDQGGNLTTAGTVNGTSDRSAKENFTSVDPTEILARVAALPISEWSYKADGETRHIGPMAQDFYAAFNVGADDKHITMVDADGVALAAIQGLNQKLEHKDAEIAELKARLEKLERLLLAHQGGLHHRPSTSQHSL